MLFVTASIGAALVDRADRDIQDVIERADLALYSAKSAGRNHVSAARAPKLQRRTTDPKKKGRREGSPSIVSPRCPRA